MMYKRLFILLSIGYLPSLYAGSFPPSYYDGTSFWLALFVLPVIAILVLFVSSEHINKIRPKIVHIQDVLQQKPHRENRIEASTKKIAQPISASMYGKPEKNATLKALKETKGVNRESLSLFSHATVLIAEDNPMNRKILRGILEPSGMTVICVDNGQEAVNIISKNSEVDLVLMDTDMPVMNGYEATLKIRKMYTAKSLPIIAIAGSGFIDEMEKISEVGVNSYLHKPFKLGELYTAFATYAKEEQLKVKNVANKLKRYEGNAKVLDVKLGIKRSMTAIFYKETLREAQVTLRNYEKEVEYCVVQREDAKLKSILPEIIRLSEVIGAHNYVKILKEIDHLFSFKEEYRLSEYFPYYLKAWKELDEEITEYLKS